MDHCPSDASSSFVHKADQSKGLKCQPITSEGLTDIVTLSRQFYQSEPAKVSDEGEGEGKIVHRARLSQDERRKRKIEADREHRKNQKLNELSAKNRLLNEECHQLSVEILQLKEELSLRDQKKLESYFSNPTNRQHDQKDVSVQIKRKMDLSASDASSTFVHNQDDQSKDLKFQPIRSGNFFHYLVPRSQSYQSEPSKVSDQKEGRDRRHKLSESERIERKKQNDRKYRVQKQMRLKELIAENNVLKTEHGQLNEEIRRLREVISRQNPGRQLSSQDLMKLESYISQSTIQQHDKQDVSVQFSGFHMSRVLDPLKVSSSIEDLSKISSINKGVVDEYLTKYKENFLSGTLNDSSSITQLLTKIDADDKSNVSLSDFPGLLEEDCLVVGGFTVPVSLSPTCQRISEVYGDISATSMVNASVSQMIYVLFCATIKEMDELKLEQVTENKILKWRDVIKDALRINFRVEFALDHLKKIASAYIGLVLQRDVECSAVSILKAEADLKNKRENLAKLIEQAKLYIDSLGEFIGKSVITGLF